MSDFLDDYEEARASRGSGLQNGDWIARIVGWEAKSRGKDGTAKFPYVDVGFSIYANLDGEPGPEFKFRQSFFIYPRPEGETPGQKQARQIALGRLKQLMFSITGRELSKEEFAAMLAEKSEWIDEQIGVRLAWTKRYKDPSKSEISVDRYFCANPKDGKFVDWEGKAIGPFSEAVLAKSIRESLFNGSSSGGSQIAQRAMASADLDDEVPF